ncbi:MAG: ribonuclease R [Lachnospiraceae bacterium]|nr:ribonuclease R [Lachnospiraceae bacterium]
MKKKRNTEKIITGTFIGHAKGYGFLREDAEDGNKKADYFVPEDMTNGAFHMDRVEAVLLPDTEGRRPEVKITNILERGITKVVGTFERSKNFGFVVPDSAKIAKDIFIPLERSKGAVTGHKVVAEITDYGRGRRSPEGKITEIIGHINDPGVDILSIVKGFDLPVAFPEKVLNQAEREVKEVEEADRVGRLDLRNLLMVTIDGEDAKDLDDAVSLTVDEETGRYHLGVHIADVSNYVQENSALDREALKRGTSVYLVDRVIPMLPHALSNGICSLNEGEDRLTLSCLMEIDKEGNIADYKITESVIRVNRRMTYTDVAKIIVNNDEETCKKYEELVPMLLSMKELSMLLREKRMQRGAIDFDFPESKITLDAEGRPLEIKPYERNLANMLIEDFMLAANETVAQHFYWQELPFVYRIHEKPDGDKMQKLNIFINNLGYYMKSVGKAHRRVAEEEIHPKEIQKLLKKIAGTPEEALVSRLTLRSMKQARYSTVCEGHFGLACDYYCHFTSPIRRYPDLQIHRIIKDQLRNRMSEEKALHYESILPEVAKHSSETERRAEEAERETDKLKKMEYMAERIGEEYEGIISGITAWGIYVELPNTVEGMVHVSRLPGDYYFYDENLCEMIGEHTGRSYCLGEPVKIKVTGTDSMTKAIDFDIVEDTGEDDAEE